MKDRALTPEQKKEITDRLLAAWLRNPALRLGQLIFIVHHSLANRAGS